MYSQFQKEEPSSLTGSPLFIRRVDLSSEDRHKIGSIALLFKKHGVITGLAERYKISRQFVYNLRDDLKSRQLFTLPSSFQSKLDLRRHLLRTILCLRLVCISSLSAISETLKLLHLGKCSTASISQHLASVGGQLDNTLSYEGQLQVMSDEIFISRNQPILLTIEAQSSCILRIDLVGHSLNKQAWLDHWGGMKEKGMTLSHMTNDEGRPMKYALKEIYPDLDRQMDTFHTIAKQLGIFNIRYENLFEKAFEDCYQREKHLDKALTRNGLKTQEKMFLAALKAEEALLKAIEGHETFQKFYFEILKQLQIFDKEGQLRTFQFAKKQILKSVEGLRPMQTKVLKKVLDEIVQKIDDLLAFLKKASKVYHKLQTALPQHLLSPCCLVWQWQRNLMKAKSVKHRKYAQGKIEQYQLMVKGLCEQMKQNVTYIQEFVNFHLDQVIQSSALVETINSLLRPYLNTSKGQVTQHQLNMIMFYLNHRVYKRGKRKGKSPIEILTGIKSSKNPIDLLVDKVLPI